MSKHVQIGDWIFEVKMVRALKVGEYGQPYTAIANCNINGDAMYVDGLLTKEGQSFTRDDFKSFNEFCQNMELKQCSYHRYQNGQSKTKGVVINPSVEVLSDESDNYIHLIK
jgi:hypothetical protein